MPIAVDKEKKITVASLDGLDNLTVERIETYRNPFSTMLEMVKYYFGIYKEENIDKLRLFLKQDSEKDDHQIAHIDMWTHFVVSMVFNAYDPWQDSDWMNFDSSQVESLLEDDFFDDYNRQLSAYKEVYKREYPLLDVYTFVRLEAYATTVLPVNELWDVNYIWTFQDFIEYIYGFGWFKTIAIVYNSMGIHWFADNGENDPIKYIWACMAVDACKKTGAFEGTVLKRDLTTIYKELLIAFTIRGTLEKNIKTVEHVQKCITDFDEERIKELIDSVSTLTKEKDQLISEKKQLDEGITLLRAQVQELQKSDEESDFDKIEEIAYKLNVLSPQNEAIDDKVKQFQSIWEQLDKTTKKDIKLSIAMFEKFDSFDLALFPMIRSLEHEMNQNFFIPFHNSKVYRTAGRPFCRNNSYLKTHDALVKNLKTHPTMGNIPFIGKAMSDIRAQEASNIINAFNLFLGNKKKSFIEICNALDTYRIGTERLRLVDLRNGIAHGDDNVTTKIDKNCYEDVRNVLYEPPLQILIKVIKNSMRLVK